MTSETRKCPLCAEEIEAGAKFCSYCGTKFQVTATGYCTQCHTVVETDETGRCRQCGSDVADRRVESTLVEEPTRLPTQPPSVVPTVVPPPRKGRGGWWALAIVLALVLCCCVLGLGGGALGLAWGFGGNLPVAGLLATATPTRTAASPPTRIPVPTAAPMPTVPPEPTMAPVPTVAPAPTRVPTRTPAPTARPATKTPVPTPRRTPTVAATTASGSATVQGRVLWNSQPFDGVTVKLCSDWSIIGGCKGVEYKTVAGADGSYRITGVAPGKYSFVTKMPGQTSETMWLGMSVEVQAGQTLTVRDVNVIKYDLQLVSPGNKTTVNTRTPTLTWAAYPGAAYYKVYLVNAKSYKTVVSFVKVTGTQYTVSTALELAEYYWRIYAYNASGIEIAENQALSYFTVVGP